MPVEDGLDIFTGNTHIEPHLEKGQLSQNLQFGRLTYPGTLYFAFYLTFQILTAMTVESRIIMPKETAILRCVVRLMKKGNRT